MISERGPERQTTSRPPARTRGLVITRFAATVPPGYLPRTQDGAVTDVRDLERFEHFPHPAVALPTGRTEERGFVRLPVYEIYALGKLRH